jgi:hypothetical protein
MSSPLINRPPSWGLFFCAFNAFNGINPLAVGTVLLRYVTIALLHTNCPYLECSANYALFSIASNPVTITIESASGFDYIAQCVASDHWLMSMALRPGPADVFDEYFTSDIFDLAREELMPRI